MGDSQAPPLDNSNRINDERAHRDDVPGLGGSPGWTRTNNPAVNTSAFIDFHERSETASDLGKQYSAVVTGFH